MVLILSHFTSGNYEQTIRIRRQDLVFIKQKGYVVELHKIRLLQITRVFNVQMLNILGFPKNYYITAIVKLMHSMIQ